MMDMRPPRTPRHRRLTREEISLWTEITRTIKPRRGAKLPEEPEAGAAHDVKAPVAQELRLPTPAVHPEKPKKAIPPLVPVEKRLRQKLSRGRIDVQMKIDLHGMRQEEAHHALLGFLTRAHANDAQIVLVVTGKGKPKLPDHGAQFETGVLRRMVPHWLAAPEMRAIVLGFEEASPTHGGSGALYVRLRRRRILGLDAL